MIQIQQDATNIVDTTASLVSRDDMLEAVIRRCVHCDHKGMDMLSNIIHSEAQFELQQVALTVSQWLHSLTCIHFLLFIQFRLVIVLERIPAQAKGWWI